MPMPMMMPMMMGGAQSAMSMGASGASKPLPGGYVVPTKSCKFFEEGKCAKGSGCTFIHGSSGGRGGGRQDRGDRDRDRDRKRERSPPRRGSGSGSLSKYGPGASPSRDNASGSRGGGNSTICFEYQQTGSCKYGKTCKFDHPAGAGGSDGKEGLGPTGLPIHPGAQNCKFYMDNGKCKFGIECKFNHPPSALDKIRQQMASTTMGPHGLPVRPDAEECYLFKETGHCRFGATCKFDHPVSTGQHSYVPHYQSSSSYMMPASAATGGYMAAPAAPQMQSSMAQPMYASASHLNTQASYNQMPVSAPHSSASQQQQYSPFEPTTQNAAPVQVVSGYGQPQGMSMMAQPQQGFYYA